MAKAVYSRNSTLKLGNRQHKKIKFLIIIIIIILQYLLCTSFKCYK